MSHHPVQETPESIDQVIQREKGLPVSEQENPHVTHPNDRFNMSTPLPDSPVPRPTTRSGSSAQRYEMMTSQRSDPRPKVERRETVSERENRDALASKKNHASGDDGASGSSKNETLAGSPSVNFTDFFGPDIFQIVIHNPTTAHRLLKFCQSRACAENMEFLQKVHAYNRLLDDVAQTLAMIHSTYISADSPSQINISHARIKNLSADIKETTGLVLPSLEGIFAGAQDHVERLLHSDIYPRFVKHQVTASATVALIDQRERFQGLGDCFCLTDPLRADNPIIFASDGFVSVTGYSRKDIILRNCRFLQGELTDRQSCKRLRASIDDCEETVELLLNYRKNGDPFWNLLYVSPLLNERGEVVFFLGGQVNCSTTIHSCTDVLKILSANDDELDKLEEMVKKTPPSSLRGKSEMAKVRSSYFKSFRKYKGGKLASSGKMSVRDEAGMEPELMNRLGKLSFSTQVEAFYTAYSKYLVLSFNPLTHDLVVKHYSPGIIDMLGLNLPNGTIAPIFHKDVFRVLAENSLPSSSVAKAFRSTVRDAILKGKAVSVETGLMTGYEEKKEKKEKSSFFSRDKEKDGKDSARKDVVGGGKVWVRVEERYATHWTPLKDEEGRVTWVVLTIAPKM